MENSSKVKQIFLSHEKNDIFLNELARALLHEFNNRGYKVWSEKYLSPGNEWVGEINEALEKSDFMIALLDQHSFSSKYVRNELQYALFNDNYKNRLLPILVRESKEEKFPNIPWFLKFINYIEISKNQSTESSVNKIANHFQNSILKKEDNNAL